MLFFIAVVILHTHTIKIVSHPPSGRSFHGCSFDSLDVKKAESKAPGFTTFRRVNMNNNLKLLAVHFLL